MNVDFWRNMKIGKLSNLELSSRDRCKTLAFYHNSALEAKWDHVYKTPYFIKDNEVLCKFLDCISWPWCLLSTLFVFDSTVLWNHDQISRQVNSLTWVRRFNVWVLHPFRLVYRLVKNPRPWANLCHLAGSQGRRRAARRCLAGLIWRLVGASFTTLPFFLRPVSMLTTL